MENKYIIPATTRIGHVHLKVSSIENSLKFYIDLLGFTLVTTIDNTAAFIAAGGYHHHIGLNTWYSKGAGPAPANKAGLYHVAILYAERKELAVAVSRLQEKKYPISGAADHGVSEAIYIEDPDKNGIELYWDKPQNSWPKNEEGKIEMYTKPLDINDLLKELK